MFKALPSFPMLEFGGILVRSFFCFRNEWSISARVKEREAKTFSSLLIKLLESMGQIWPVTDFLI